MSQSPLILLPGWGLGHGPFQPLMDALPGCQCIDLPGYGDTPLTDDFTAAADHILAALPDQAVLVGWSLGAMLAMACGARQPGKIRQLILIAGTPSFVQREGWPYAMAPEQLAEFTSAVAADFAAMLPRFVGGFNRGDEQAKATTRRLLELASPKAANAALATGLAWLRDVDLRPLLAQITVPTLVIHGAHDPLMPMEGARWLTEQLPNARLEVFETCAHAPFISEHDRFLALLQAQRAI